MVRSRLLAIAVVALAWSPPALAADATDIPLPRGTRPADPGSRQPLYVSGRGFRDTVDHVRRQLRHRGVLHDEVPTYRRRGVTVSRFLIRDAASRFRAIHVFNTGARTLVFIVPGAPSDAPHVAPSPSGVRKP